MFGNVTALEGLHVAEDYKNRSEQSVIRTPSKVD